MIDGRLLDRLYQQAHAGRWRVATDAFADALEASVAKAFAGKAPSRREVERYLAGLHLEDLALAVACASGDEEAWGHFVLEYRPALYRTVDGLDPAGGARDIADSLYAELFGLDARARQTEPLFRYFHGRSSLSTWLRAVVTQRHIDRVRANRRTAPLPDDASAEALVAAPKAPDPQRERYVALMRTTLMTALAVLAPKDRLRLACYYAQELTLAQTGRLLGEHEATVSRHLAKSRRAVRASVEQQLRADHGLTDGEVAECFESIVADAGPIDLGEVLANVPELGARKELEWDDRKELEWDRSSEERPV